MKFFFFTFCLLLATFTQSIAQSIDAAKIDQLLESKIKAGAPGLAVGIVKNGTVEPLSLNMLNNFLRT